MHPRPASRSPVIRHLLLQAREHWADPFYRNSYFMMGNYLIPAALGFLFLKVVSGSFSADDVGLASTLLSVGIFLSTVSGLGLGAVTNRFLPAMGPEERARYVNTSLWLIGVSSVALALLFGWLAPFVSPELSIVRADLVLGSFTIAVTCFAWSAFFDSVFVSTKTADMAFWKNTAAAAMRFPSLVVLGFGFASLQIFSAYTLSFMLGAVGSVVLARRVLPGYLPRPQFDPAMLRGRRRYAFANQSAEIVLTFQMAAGSLLVLHHFGASDAAYYYVAITIMSLVYLVPQAISVPLLREAIEPGADFGHHMRKALMFTAILLVPAIVALTVFGDIVLGLFNKEYAANGRGLLVLLALSAIPAGLNTLYFAKLRLDQRNGELLLLSGASAVSALLLIHVLAVSGATLTLVGLAFIAAQSLVLLYALPRLIVDARRRN